MNSQISTEVSLSILIVNFNGKGFLDACFDSIKKNIQVSHEIIVVDNSSQDGSTDYIRECFPEIILVVSNENLGFAGGNNLGAQYANGKFLLLLNNDTVLLDDISQLLKLMGDDSSIGIAGVRMVGRDGEYRKSVGYFPNPLRLIKFSSLYVQFKGFECGDIPVEPLYYPVDWVEGSFLLTPLTTWRLLGGLDVTYFMYVEDVDFARRVTDSGMRVIYYPSLSYIHFGGYGQSRMGMLINGFRHYHNIHSSFFVRLLANLILDFGLVVRAFIALLAVPFNSSAFDRSVYCINALRRKK